MGGLPSAMALPWAAPATWATRLAVKLSIGWVVARLGVLAARGFYESPLYRYVKGNLEKTGALEENLRVKRKSFYQEAE